MTNINAYLRKDGRWEVRIYSTDNSVKRSYKSVYGKTKEEAEAKAALRSLSTGPLLQLPDIFVILDFSVKYLIP